MEEALCWELAALELINVPSIHLLGSCKVCARFAVILLGCDLMAWKFPSEGGVHGR